MLIFIAKDYNNITRSIVLAQNENLAKAYWQDEGIVPHYIEERHDIDLENHPTRVLPLLKTHTKTMSPFGGSLRDVVLVTKG